MGRIRLWRLLGFVVAVGVWAPAVLGANGRVSTTTGATTRAVGVSGERGTDYGAAAREVTRYIQSTFYLPKDGLYAHSVTKRHPDYMWGNGVLFSALVGAARHEPRTYLPVMGRFFKAMDRYWDTGVKVPGYEPLPTKGGGNDKYYDDNAWMVLAYLEAFELTRDRAYLVRAQQTMAFVMSGWDEQRGGGIWWHEGHKDGTKNTCVNAPAAVGWLRLAGCLPAEGARAAVAEAGKIVDWTDRNLRDADGLYSDRIYVDTGKVNTDRLTYNTALMIRAYLGLYRATGDEGYLGRAKRTAEASNWFLDKRTGAYRDAVKWAHLMVEADLEMYRATGEAYLLKRAADNAEYEYARWKEKRPGELIDNASVARTLWLMADVGSAEGRGFWERVERVGK